MPGYAPPHLVKGLFALGMALGKELVGIADDLLLDGLRLEVARRQGEVLREDVGEGEARAGVPLGHARMAREAFGAQDVGAGYAVLDVGAGTMAMNVGRIGLQYAYIVEHGGLVDELAIGTQLGMGIHHLQRALRHLPRMQEQEAPQLGLPGIVLIYQGEGIHGGV